MITAVFNGGTITTAHGITQWDYGQELHIVAPSVTIPDNTEINFYQGDLTALRYVVGNQVMIPDRMLQDTTTILAYIYVRTDTSGETILLVKIPVADRPRPSDYVMQDMDEYTRLLPVGGQSGEVPVRTDTGIVWGLRADGLRLDDNGNMQLKSGNLPIGEKIRIPSGGAGGGREIELKNDGTAIAWRYTDSNDWTTLVTLDDLRGPAGETPEFEVREGHLFAIYT